MVARGRRTHGRFITASDTAGSHWHLDNFSGNRRYRGYIGGERWGIIQVWQVQSPFFRHHVRVTHCWLFIVKESARDEKTLHVKDWMSGVAHYVKRKLQHSECKWWPQLRFSQRPILLQWNTYEHTTHTLFSQAYYCSNKHRHCTPWCLPILWLKWWNLKNTCSNTFFW